MEQGRRDVGQLDQGVAPKAGAEVTGPGPDQRDPRQALEEADTLLSQAVIAERLAVIGREDDDGIVTLAGPLERVQDPTELLVDLRRSIAKGCRAPRR